MSQFKLYRRKHPGYRKGDTADVRVQALCLDTSIVLIYPEASPDHGELVSQYGRKGDYIAQGLVGEVWEELGFGLIVVPGEKFESSWEPVADTAAQCGS